MHKYDKSKEKKEGWKNMIFLLFLRQREADDDINLAYFLLQMCQMEEIKRNEKQNGTILRY